MAAQPDAAQKPRPPLTRERVLRAGVELADERGIESLTMRNLGHELGVEAMSLYNHVNNKEDVLDGLVEVVVGEVLAAVAQVEPVSGAAGWKDVMRARILAAARSCCAIAGQPRSWSRARTSPRAWCRTTTRCSA